MDEFVVLNIECDFLGDRDVASVIQVPFDISWDDFVFLIKLHLDCQDIQIKYLDEENDFVSMNRQDELCEAFRLSRKCGNVMNIKVISTSNIQSIQRPPPLPRRIDNVQKVLLDMPNRPICLLPMATDKKQDTTNMSNEDDKQESRPEKKESAVEMDHMQSDQQEVEMKKTAEDSCTKKMAECCVTLQPPLPVDALKKSCDKIQLPMKQKKKELYTQMAREIGHRRKRGVYPRLRHMHSNESVDSETECSELPCNFSDEEPPVWFQRYMDKFKKEITDEMANLVTRRVVRQVINSLDGAVIHSMHGTSGQPGTETKPTAAKSQPMETAPAEPSTSQTGQDKHPVYCHVGVVCDSCEQTIVGIRYKCGNCEDFDLCEQCEMKEGIHHPDHVFIKIRKPILFAGRRKIGKMSPLFKKSLYHPDESKLREVESFAAFQWEKFQEKILKKAEKLKRKEEKYAECMIKKEEKLKRRLEHQRETPHKKEKLDIPSNIKMRKMDAEFIKDDTIPDGTRVQPGTRLLKRWLMRNTGTSSFTETTKLKLMWGNLPPSESDVAVPALNPGEEGIFTVEHVAPQEPGKYQSHWRLYDEGRRFGHRIWCSVIVEQKEVLEPSQSESVLNVVNAQQQQKPGDEVTCTEAVPSDVAVALLKEQQKQEDQQTTAQGVDLTSRDLLSFEMLEIRDRSPPEVSQTATPTNTPLDVTPPKSPVPELALTQLSNSSSSVEIVGDEEENDDAASRLSATALMTELVQQRMASLGMKTDDEDILSLSSDDDSSDGEFYIVPLPDCFQTDKPITRSTLTTNTEIVDKNCDNDDVVYVGDDYEDLTVSEEHPDVFVETNDGSIILSEPGSKSAETVIEVDASSDAGQERAAAVALAQQLSDEENNNNPEMRGAEAGDTEDDVQLVAASADDSVSGKDGEEKQTSASPPQTDAVNARPKTPPSPTEVAGKIVNSAFNVASHAAAAAYTTAKDVFHTLQARNQYVPPRSEWKPKPSEWTPPKDTYQPPKNDWTPPKDTYTPPKNDWTPPKQIWSPPNCCPKNEEQTALDQLFEMGFCNRQQNTELLQKYNNDVGRVIQELLSQEDSNWFQNRH